MKSLGSILVLLLCVWGTAPVSTAAQDGGGHRAKDRKLHRDRDRDGKADGKERRDRDHDGKPDGKERAERAGERVDQRQERQENRIQHGIEKGYLTESEVTRLRTMESNIEKLESSYKSDGKLTRSEAKELKSALNHASLNIWAEKHDTEGAQMPTYRYGKNVFAKDALTSRIESDEISGAEAKALLKEFRQASELKRKLGSQNLSADKRAQLQEQYNEFLNKYFEVRG